jgi:hypothetical protein
VNEAKQLDAQMPRYETSRLPVANTLIANIVVPWEIPCAANVTCSGPDLTMRICYNPLSPNGSATNDWTLASEGFASNPQCQGIAVNDTSAAEHPWCAAGNLRLTLFLNASKLSECGTKITTEVSE